MLPSLAAPLGRLTARQASPIAIFTRPFTNTTRSQRLILPSRASKTLLKPCTAPPQQIASLATAAVVAEPPARDTHLFDAVATGGIPYPGIPHFEDLYQKRQWQLEHLAGAFRVFARLGFNEGAAGHISVRDTIDTDTFWINP
ncbi:hypothetical protein G7046_g9817 [Stylonectria norvegica]|nr:hypothetical protein G7046_g9817 [Stylonectria norvegica]